MSKMVLRVNWHNIRRRCPLCGSRIRRTKAWARFNMTLPCCYVTPASFKVGGHLQTFPPVQSSPPIQKHDPLPFHYCAHCLCPNEPWVSNFFVISCAVYLAAAPNIACDAVRRFACDHKGDRHQRGDGAVG